MDRAACPQISLREIEPPQWCGAKGEHPGVCERSYLLVTASAAASGAAASAQGGDASDSATHSAAAADSPASQHTYIRYCAVDIAGGCTAGREVKLRCPGEVDRRGRYSG